MCGICGMFGISDEKLLSSMKENIKHRGPDGDGSYFDPVNKLAFGHLRLSIIDLSENGKQPMISADGDYAITFNGEVYNYIEIRNELKSLGYSFHSNTDTEVVLYAYMQWKEKCLDKFNGMFAFAIWDKKHKELFCARDRFGVKPFYYYNNNGVFLFASEIKAILAYNQLVRKANDDLVYDYLVDGFVDHTDQTFFLDVYKLMPGHYMKVDINNHITISKYWDMVISNKLDDGSNKEQVVSEFRSLFEDSIKLRLRSDVPVGSCLSGGMDSSSIVCEVNNQLKSMDNINKSVIGERQKTFSSCSEDKRFDERYFIEYVTDKTGVEKEFIFPDSNDLIRDIEKLVYYQEEPFTSTSIYAQWSIMRKAREKGVIVLLDGQGADEIMAGYRKFRIYLFKELIRSRKYVLALNELLNGIYQFRTSNNLKQDLFKIFRIYGKKKKNHEFMQFINKDFLAQKRNRKNVIAKDFATALYNDIKKYSLPSLLRYEDKNSMVFAIESRVPFLDYRLAEYVASLPLVYKINNGWSKWILREAMKGIIPDTIRLRKDKMGFVTSEQQWLKEKKDYFIEIFSDKDFMANKYIDRKMVIDAFDKIVEGKVNANLWRLINLELWLRCYFKK